MINSRWREHPPKDKEEAGVILLKGLLLGESPGGTQTDLNWFYPLWWGGTHLLGKVRPICLIFEFDLDLLDRNVWSFEGKSPIKGFFAFFEKFGKTRYEPARDSTIAVTPFDIDLSAHLKRVYLPNNIDWDTARFQKLKTKWEQRHVKFHSYNPQNPPDLETPYPF